MNITAPLSQEVWERTPAEAQAYRRALEARVAALEATVQHRLERLRMDSQHSSQPPSSEPPATRRPRQRRTPSGRKPGGPPGPQGQSRTVVPLEDVAAVLPVTPTHCSRCHHPLHGEDDQPQRPQGTALPPVKPVVTAYQLHRLVCPACGATTRAALPLGVPPGGFGPRGPATGARCTGAYHLSKRTPQDVLADLCALPLRLGTMAKLEQATVEAVAAPVAAAQTSGRAQSSAHLDATGGRAGHRRAWLWVAVTAWGTVCVVRLSRGAKGAQALLGERLCGIVVTDRWRASTWYPTRWRQVCWAPLLRDCAAMMERGGRSQELGKALRMQARQRLPGWHQVRDGTLTHAQGRVLRRPLRRHVARLLKAGPACGVAKTAGGCRAVLKGYEALWTFGRVEGIAPTNHVAERASRPGVLWRPGRCGTQRAQGARFVEAMMTVVATLKQHHRTVLASMTAACQAAYTGLPAPSLLPRHTEAEEDLPVAA